MNKAEFIEVLATHFDGNRAEAGRALQAITQTITYQVSGGEKVTITGFGVFEKVHRPARLVRNPRTGERLRAKATAVPRFRAGSELKAYLSGAKKVPKATKKTAAKAAVPATKSPATTTAPVKAAATKTAPVKAAAVTSAPAATKAATKSIPTQTPIKPTTAKKTPATTATASTSPAKTTAKKTPAKATTARTPPAQRTAPAKTAPAKKTTVAKKASTTKVTAQR